MCISLACQAQSDERNIVYYLSSDDEKMVALLEKVDALNDHRYKLYKTENLYNMLRLDTKTGKIKQVQWSLDSYKEFTVVINDQDFSRAGYVSGCFELYPTNNMYQFILMDTKDGRMWHVQWGTGNNERWIRKIDSLDW